MRDWAAWCRTIQAQAASDKARATRLALLRAIAESGSAGISTVRLADVAERSRTTVRDTCRMLAAAGMIERAPTLEQGFAWRLTERAVREFRTGRGSLCPTPSPTDSDPYSDEAMHGHREHPQHFGEMDRRTSAPKPPAVDQ